MKYQFLFSLKNNEKNLCMLSAAIVIGTLRVKVFLEEITVCLLPPYSIGVGSSVKKE